MKRRAFLRGALGLPLLAAMPVAAIAAQPKPMTGLPPETEDSGPIDSTWRMDRIYDINTDSMRYVWARQDADGDWQYRSLTRSIRSYAL